MTQWLPWIFSIRDSIVASIPACHAGDRGSIPRRGVQSFCLSTVDLLSLVIVNQSHGIASTWLLAVLVYCPPSASAWDTLCVLYFWLLNWSKWNTIMSVLAIAQLVERWTVEEWSTWPKSSIGHRFDSGLRETLLHMICCYATLMVPPFHVLYWISRYVVHYLVSWLWPSG